MLILIFCFSVGTFISGLIILVHLDDYNQKLQIHEALIKSLQDKNDLHNL